MKILSVTHRTQYRYARPVALGEHRAMFRPRDSHDMQLLDTKLTVSPPATIRWMHDVYSNSIAIVSFDQPSNALLFESSFRIAHFGLETPDYTIRPWAQYYPFHYRQSNLPDLMPLMRQHYEDTDGSLEQWAQGFVNASGRQETWTLVNDINSAIKRDFSYVRREEFGVQSPQETLRLGTGSCRDFAVLMMEALRTLGLAARFVTGYLYDPALDHGPNQNAGYNTLGAGATHAWVQVYLPGAGWVEFDPTNGIVAGTNLIRIGVARAPSGAVPLSGTYDGTGADFLGMDVAVDVTAEAADLSSY